MRTLLTTWVTPAAATLSLLLTVTSLTWCGDADCLTQAGSDDCCELLCALVASQSSSQSDGGAQRADHPCASHVPTLVTAPLSVGAIAVQPTGVFEYPSLYISPFQPPVDHPPLT